MKQLIDQQRLSYVLQSIFPNEIAIENSRKTSSISNPSTGSFLEIDVWYPNINLGFEFQDVYHYKSAWYCHTILSDIKFRDDTKSKVIFDKGIYLISVPMWWDGKVNSLQATIQFFCPHLVEQASADISITLNPPKDFNIMEHEQLMLVSFPQHAITFNESPWWLGEKYDGVHCYWNSQEKTLYSRNGYEIITNISFSIEEKTVIDAELWGGRGNFLSVLNSLPSCAKEGEFLRVICFDKVEPTTQPYEYRYSSILRSIDPQNPFLIPAFRMLCEDKETLEAQLQNLIAWDAEGVILQLPRSPYVPGRSQHLLKLKV